MGFLSGLAGPLIGAAGSLLGGFVGSNGASDAADSGAAASANQIDYARETRDLGLAINAPQRQAGYTALAGLMDMAGLSRPMTGSGQAGVTARPMEFSSAYNKGYTGRFKNFTDQDWTAFQKLRTDDPAAFAAETAKMGVSQSNGVNIGGRQVGGTSRPRFDFNDFMQKANGPGNDVPNLAGMPKYNWQTDPGYQFRLQQGQDSLEASAFARGGGMSGGTAKATMDWGQNLASAEYGNVFNRLATIAGYGTSGNNASTNIVGQTGSGMADAAGQAGAYRASGQVGSANAWAGGINDLARGFGNYFGAGAGQQSPNTGSVGGGGYRYGPV